MKVKVLPKLTFVSVPRRPTPTLEPFHIGETVPVCNGEVSIVTTEEEAGYPWMKDQLVRWEEGQAAIGS